MGRSRVAVWCAVLTASVISSGSVSVWGHHSFAMFDTGKQVTLTGTVTAFEWTNPHVYIELDVAEGTATRHWTIELGSPSILMRGGWKFNTLKAGDKVTAVVNPLRNGDPGSLLSRITLADGRALGNGGPAPGAASPPPGATPSK